MILYTMKNSDGITLVTYKDREIGAGYIDKLQYYDECKLVRILGGCGIWEINGKTYPFEKDDIFLFSACDIRRLKKTLSPIKIEQVNFIPPSVKACDRCTNVFFIRTADFSNKLQVKSKANDICGSFDKLRECVKAKDFTYRDEYILNLLCTMVIAAARCYPENSEKSIQGDEICAKAMKYISNNLSEPLSLFETARQFGFSAEHFSKLFRQSAGIPYSEYVARRRVNAVICELSRGGTNVLQAAFKHGFKSSSGFYKTFYRITGCTPKSFFK